MKIIVDIKAEKDIVRIILSNHVIHFVGDARETSSPFSSTSISIQLKNKIMYYSIYEILTCFVSVNQGLKKMN